MINRLAEQNSFKHLKIFDQDQSGKKICSHGDTSVFCCFHGWIQTTFCPTCLSWAIYVCILLSQMNLTEGLKCSYAVIKVQKSCLQRRGCKMWDVFSILSLFVSMESKLLDCGSFRKLQFHADSWNLKGVWPVTCDTLNFLLKTSLLQ